MPTAEHMRDAALKYFSSFAAADVDAVVAVFADDAAVEDPIDGGYSFAPEGDVRVAANHAPCAAIATCDKADPLSGWGRWTS
jgi:hypothetical protein